MCWETARFSNVLVNGTMVSVNGCFWVMGINHHSSAMGWEMAHFSYVQRLGTMLSVWTCLSIIEVDPWGFSSSMQCYGPRNEWFSYVISQGAMISVRECFWGSCIWSSGGNNHHFSFIFRHIPIFLCLQPWHQAINVPLFIGQEYGSLGVSFITTVWWDETHLDFVMFLARGPWYQCATVYVSLIW